MPWRASQPTQGSFLPSQASKFPSFAGTSSLPPTKRRPPADGFVTTFPVAAARGVVGRQNPSESFPELGVEYGVNDRVEGRVGVTQPCEYLEHDARYAGLAESGNYVHAEERHPAYQEDTHDDTHRYGSLVVRHVVWGGLVVHLHLAGKGVFGRGGVSGRVRVHGGTEVGSG